MSVTNTKTVLILNSDVTNPKPDRRMKGNVGCVEGWSKGTLWLRSTFQRFDDPILMSLRCRGLLGDVSHWGMPEQWNALEPHLQEFKFEEGVYDATQFAALHLLHNFDFELLVKHLFRHGLLPPSLLVSTQKAIDEMEDANDVWKPPREICNQG